MTTRIGDIGEHYAASWFLEKGLEVFMNASGCGKADMILWSGDKMMPVDIKTLRSPYTRKDGSYSLSQTPRFTDDGIAIVVYVLGEDAVRLPEGFWEHFE